MTAVAFDTHEFYRELVDSGLAEKTADALTKAVTKIEQAKIDELATKGDVKELEIKIEWHANQRETKTADQKQVKVRVRFATWQ